MTEQQNLLWAVVALTLSVMVLLLFYLLVNAHRRLRREVLIREEAIKLRQRLLLSEMRALRSQTNPHFIFNAINSIQHYVLINERELANRYLVKFSKLISNVLELSKEELIPLKEELETARLYLEIESLRFNNAFEFSIFCDSESDASKVSLPPLLIQPFIKNATWHGLLLKEGRKTLDIEVRRSGQNVVIDIDDNGIGRKMAGHFHRSETGRRSFGLNITKERLKALNKMRGLDISFVIEDKKSAKRAEDTRVKVNIKNPIPVL